MLKHDQFICFPGLETLRVDRAGGRGRLRTDEGASGSLELLLLLLDAPLGDCEGGESDWDGTLGEREGGVSDCEGVRGDCEGGRRD